MIIHPRRAPGGGASGVSWTAVTQAHLGTASTVRTGLKSIAESAGRVTVTCNALAARVDGIQETSGVTLALTTVLPAFDPVLHDVLVWLDAPASTNDNMHIAVALVSNASTPADGLGVSASAIYAASQGVSTLPSLTSEAGQLDVHGRFTLSGASAGAVISSRTWRRTAAGAWVAAVSTAAQENGTIDTTGTVYLYIQCPISTTSMAVDTTASAGIYLATTTRFQDP